MSSAKATVQRIEVIAAGHVVESVAGGALAASTIRPGTRKPGTTIGAGRFAVVVMDVTVARDARVPRQLVHRITISLRPREPAAATTYDAARVSVVQRAAVVIAAPLRGAGWLVASACCDALTSHRAAVLPVNGALHVAERFAIDFVQLDRDRRLFSGPLDSFSSYGFYGDPVLSVSGGTVVSEVNTLPEATPGHFPTGISAQDAGGNNVVVALGHGRWALYAHLQPGSITVRVGQRVHAGQTLGLLGNSGNSDAPHLHFQIMDGPSPLSSNGLPFRFVGFKGEGRLTNLVKFMEGSPAAVSPRWRGMHHRELPLNDQIIDFG